MPTHSENSRLLPQVVVCFLHSGRLKNRQRREPVVMHGHSSAQGDLFTRLSPEDGDDVLSARVYLLRCGISHRRIFLDSS